MERRSKIFFFLILCLLISAVAAYFFLQYRDSINEPVPTPKTETPEEQPFLEIAPQNDCTNECVQYQNDQEKYNYCRAVCGFTVENGVEKPPVSNNPELSSDYQTKDAAVNEKNIKKCEEIKDANIKSTCKARVTEDLFEQQGGNGF